MTEQTPTPPPEPEEPWWVKYPWADSIEEVWQEEDDLDRDDD
jgi:hypothetical protein